MKIVNTTSIHKFVNGNRFGCICNIKNNPYSKKYLEFLEVCTNRNIKLLDTEEDYIEKTKKNGAGTYLKLQCLKCYQIVTTTTINKFINCNHLGCYCNKNIPYCEKYLEFLEVCTNRNVRLLDNEKIYIEKTKKNGAETYLKLQCLKCYQIATTTTINTFINSECLGCKCSLSKSERCFGDLLKINFPNNNFIKIKPNWLKNKKGNNLELDFYCKELKLAFEYQGAQHEEYNKFFHRNDINNFYKQLEHDKIKKELCEKKGIRLVCVPSKYNYKNKSEMNKYILDNY